MRATKLTVTLVPLTRSTEPTITIVMRGSVIVAVVVMVMIVVAVVVPVMIIVTTPIMYIPDTAGQY